jgi:outer membrane protein TolC
MSIPKRRVFPIASVLAAAAFALATAVGAHAAELRTRAQTLSLSEVFSHALKIDSQGEIGRARYALEQAAGAVQVAEGAFDWAFRTSTGYNRIYQPASIDGFLTTGVDSFNVLSSTMFVERQFANGIRVRPGYLVTQNKDNFRSDLARLGNRPLLQIDVPLDRSLGDAPDALRLQAAQSDRAAAQTDADFARQSYLHRVVTAVWLQVAARERAAVYRDLADRLETVAARVGRLARAGEAATLNADELRGRASLARALAERDAVELVAARIQLAALIQVPADVFAGVDTQFPRMTAADAAQRDKLPAYVDQALQRRPDVRSQLERIEAAKLRGRIGEREADSQLSLTVGHDRLLVNYYTPLGDNKRSGARRQAAAGLGAAEDGLEEAKQRVRVETQLALERLIASKSSVERAGSAMDTTRDRLALVDQLVNDGRHPPSALADAADQFAAARRQWLDANLLYTLALADFRRATGSIPEGAAEPTDVAALFVTEP